MVFDWNTMGVTLSLPKGITFDDETLRDGLQSPTVTDPTLDQKIEFLHLMEKIGIQTADIGLPGAGPRAKSDVLRLAEEIAQNGMRILPNCAARTAIVDIEPIVEVSQKVGIPILACLFLGCSQIRQYTEDWNMDRLLQLTHEAVSFAVRHQLPVMFVTEDTTRAHPHVVAQLYTEAVRSGATRVCIADTVGHATPIGAYNLVTFLRQTLASIDAQVGIDWHGHSDRGLSIENSLAAALAGADRIHGTALGIGERCGNAPMELLLLNFAKENVLDPSMDLSHLLAYCHLAAQMCEVPLPPFHPLLLSSPDTDVPQGAPISSS